MASPSIRSILAACAVAGLLAMLGAAPAVAATQPIPATTRAYATGPVPTRTIWVDVVRGSDSAPGTATRPLRTLTAAWNRIPRNVDLDRGVRIAMRRGTWTAAQVPNYFEQRHGTRAAPIRIEAVDGAGTVRLPDINMFDVRHLHLIGLRMQSGGGDVFHCERCQYLLLRDVVVLGTGNLASFDAPQEGIKINQSHHVYFERIDVSGATDNAIDFVAVRQAHVIHSTIHRSLDWCLYVKGGSYDVKVEGNEVFDCGTGGITAGQGTGFEFMQRPFIYHEAVGVRIVNNVVHDIEGAALGVNGGFDVLVAYNTARSIGTRSHLLEVTYGQRGCDGTPAVCSAFRSVGGWGRPTPGGDPDPIGDRGVQVVGNVLLNPTGTSSQWQLFEVSGPRAASAASGIPSPQRTDDELVIRGNVVWNGGTERALGLGDSEQGCQSGNATCTAVIVQASNSLDQGSAPTLRSPGSGNFAPAPGSSLLAFQSAGPESFSWSGQPSGDPYPALPTLSNAVPRDRRGAARSPISTVAGAFVKPSFPPAFVRLGRVGNGVVRVDRHLAACRQVTCSRRGEFGAWYSLTARPSNGWRFRGWSGSCRGMAGACLVQAGRGPRATARFVRT